METYTVKLFKKDSLILNSSDKFTYEISIYNIYLNRAECVGNKFYESDVPLKFKEVECINKGDYKIVKFITWLSAPLPFLLNNNFKIYENIGNKKRTKNRT